MKIELLKIPSKTSLEKQFTPKIRMDWDEYALRISQLKVEKINEIITYINTWDKFQVDKYYHPPAPHIIPTPTPITNGDLCSRCGASFGPYHVC